MASKKKKEEDKKVTKPIKVIEDKSLMSVAPKASTKEANMSTVNGPAHWEITRWKATTKSAPSTSFTSTTAPMSSVWGNNFWWFWMNIWVSSPVQDIQRSLWQPETPIGRLKPKTPATDNAMKWAAYDILNGASADEITEAYPEIVDKLPILASYLSDAYTPDIDEKKLSELYPELSDDLKLQFRAVIKPEVEKQVADQQLETEWLSAWEKASALWLGIATGAGNVWYNMTWGKQINQAGAWLWEKLKNTQFADMVRRAGERVFGKEEMAAFQQEEAIKRAWPDYFSADNQANILRSVWGRKQEQSWRGKAGKFIWEQAAITALTLPVWGIIWGLSKSVLWVAWTRAAQLARWAVVWGITGMAEQELQAIGSRWEFATTNELKNGAILGAIWGSYLSKKISSTKWNIKDIIRETEEWSSKLAALKSGSLKEQRDWIAGYVFWGKNVVKPSKKTLEAVETITKEIPNAANTPVKLYGQIKSKISEISEWLSDQLKKVKVGWFTARNKQVRTALETLATDAKDTLWGTTAKEIGKIAQKFQNMAGKTADEAREYAKQLDNMMGEKLKSWINLSSREEVTYKFWRAAREEVNNYLDDVGSSIKDVAVKDQFKKVTNLYHGANQIENKINMLTSQQIGALSKWVIGLKNAMKYGIGWAVAGKTINAVTGQ